MARPRNFNDVIDRIPKAKLAEAEKAGTADGNAKPEKAAKQPKAGEAGY